MVEEGYGRWLLLWVYQNNTIPDLPGLVREGDLWEGIYWGGRGKQTIRERLTVIKLAGFFLNI
jgi:hypothetical protein